MKEIFVFGSNLAGRHGKGAAKEALENHGARYGVGVGKFGNSYAIPTKDRELRTLDLVEINIYVAQFIKEAYYWPEAMFNVTLIGCGLAGYKPEQIAPMFRLALDLPNVRLPKEFLEVLNG